MQVITDVLKRLWRVKQNTRTLAYQVGVQLWLGYYQTRFHSVQSSPKLSILWSLLPDSKEENKVDKSEDSSNSKDNEEGVLVVNRPEIMTSEKKF